MQIMPLYYAGDTLWLGPYSDQFTMWKIKFETKLKHFISAIRCIGEKYAKFIFVYSLKSWVNLLQQALK